jgi:hypothetical protein
MLKDFERHEIIRREGNRGGFKVPFFERGI